MPKLHSRNLAALSIILGAVSLSNAAEITYNVNQPIGAGGVTGDIVTDGTIGSLSGSDFVDWNLLLNDGTGTLTLLGPLSGSNSQIIDSGDPDVSATPTELRYDFNATDDNSLLFTASDESDGGVCFTAVFGCLAPYGGQEVVIIGSYPSATPQYESRSGIDAIGTASATPEPSTITLLGAGIALLWAGREWGRKQGESRR